MISAKEKARELVEKMFQFAPLEKLPYYSNHNMAKQCALIAVDEIIDIAYWEYMESGSKEEKIYWQEVKREIEKL
jgi:hypothetical protein